MLEVRRDIFRNFLIKNDCKYTDWVMEVFEPFYKISEIGHWNLISQNDLDWHRLTSAKMLLTGSELKNAVFISDVDDLPVINGEEDRFYERNLKASIKTSTKDYYDKDFETDLKAMFMVSFCYNLGSILNATFREKGMGDFTTDVWGNITTNFLLFIGAVLQKNEKMMSAHSSILGFFEKSFILCEKKDEPNTWFIVSK